MGSASASTAEDRSLDEIMPGGAARRTLGAVTHLLARPVATNVVAPLLVVTWVSSTLMAFVTRSLLPARFYYDGHFIESIAVGRPLTAPDHIFATTGWLYWALGLTLDPLLPGIFGMLVAGILVACAVSTRSTRIPFGSMILSAAALALYSVFFAWYTKETFAAIGVTGSILLLKSQAHRLWAVAPIVAYGSFLRTYWLLVAAVYVVLLLMERLRPLRWWRLALWCAGSLCAMTIGYALVLGGSLQGVRAGVNQFRDVTDAATLITPIVPPGNMILDSASSIVTLVTLIVPIPLLMTGEAEHLIYAAAIFGLWFVVFSGSRSLRTAAPRGSNPGDPHARRVALSSLYLVVSFVTVFAIFEPDYGSYLRHLSSVIPLMVVCSIAQYRALGRS